MSKFVLIWPGNTILNVLVGIKLHELSKCFGIVLKPERVCKSTLISLYYLFSSSYLIIPTIFGAIKIHLSELPNAPISEDTKRNLIFKIWYWTCLISINLPLEYLCIFLSNRNIHWYDIHNANDIHVPYDRLDIRRFGIRIAGGFMESIACVCQRCQKLFHLFTIGPNIADFDKEWQWCKNLYSHSTCIMCCGCTSDRDLWTVLILCFTRYFMLTHTHFW